MKRYRYNYDYLFHVCRPRGAAFRVGCATYVQRHSESCGCWRSRTRLEMVPDSRGLLHPYRVNAHPSRDGAYWSIVESVIRNGFYINIQNDSVIRYYPRIEGNCFFFTALCKYSERLSDEQFTIVTELRDRHSLP